MLLTVSKRLEFSASRRLLVRGWNDAENLAAFGPETSARYGTGRNYVAYFVFSGAVDRANGMLMNISEIKARIGELLHGGFDHKFLNENNPAFADIPPTAEHVARQLFDGARPLFSDSQAQLVACHLSETPERSATIYASGACEANYWFSFSAARQTMSPHLSSSENEQLFGIAASPYGHGHNYRARLTIRQETAPVVEPIIMYEQLDDCVRSLRSELDHKNLNHEVPALRGRPITTESLVRYLLERAAACMPVARVRLHERDDFFAEQQIDGQSFVGMQMPFAAAHRLHAATLPAAENLALYGKCNNARGHGHRYLVEATIGGDYDRRAGTLCDFTAFQTGIAEALRPWQDKHLDLEAEEFRDRPSTGENIVQALWPKMNTRLDDRLTRLRLWETPNNRFALRRDGK
ncbi:MAG: 6-carboxytetrahydropterin synthase [Verrucomicrobiota bacterium]|nr:6-carboxytetrahydropterin synthase [Verrucomicrobiota bacterium]